MSIKETCVIIRTISCMRLISCSKQLWVHGKLDGRWRVFPHPCSHSCTASPTAAPTCIQMVHLLSLKTPRKQHFHLKLRSTWVLTLGLAHPIFRQVYNGDHPHSLPRSPGDRLFLPSLHHCLSQWSHTAHTYTFHSGIIHFLVSHYLLE